MIQKIPTACVILLCALLLACSGGSDGGSPSTGGGNGGDGGNSGGDGGTTPSTFTLTLLGQLSPREDINGEIPWNGNPEDGIYQGISGYTDPEGNEYALLSSSRGLSIIDIADPTNMTEVQLVPLDGGAIHRDVEVYQNYAYVGGQQGSTTSVIDLSGLPNLAPVVHTIVPSLDFSHTLNIADGHLYLNSAAGHCRIYELSNPTFPGLINVYTADDCHDSYVQGNLMISAGGFTSRFTLVDITNKAAPVILGFTPIQSGIYAHSAWLSEDGNTLYGFDEFNVHDVMIFDITDRANPTLLSTFSTPENTRIHNGAIKDGYLFLAYYESGFVVLDVSDPTNPVMVAQSQTWSDGASGDYNGAWNVHLSLPSGKLLVSDTKGGLFVYEATYE